MKQLSTEEAASKLGITDRHVRRLVAEGKLKAKRIGSRLLAIKERDLEAYMQERSNRK